MALLSRLLATLVLSANVAFSAGEKKLTTYSLPAIKAGYDHSWALSDMSQIPDSEALARLQTWLLYQSFGGEQAGQPALQQPRVAQALWLALMTEALNRGLATTNEAESQLEHLRTQKALPLAAASFFADLWKNGQVSPVSRSQRTATYLREWVTRFSFPALTAAERQALGRAIKAGFRSVDCLPAASPTSPPSKN